MSNAPVHLFDKATWETSRNGIHISFSTDVLTEVTRARYRDFPPYTVTLVDQWSVYRTTDGTQLFTVNTDGTLRSIRPYVTTSAAR